MTDPLDNTKFNLPEVGDIVRIIATDEWSVPPMESYIGEIGIITRIEQAESWPDTPFYRVARNISEERGRTDIPYFWLAESLELIERAGTPPWRKQGSEGKS